MQIKLEKITIEHINNVRKVESINDITTDVRLFHELGRYKVLYRERNKKGEIVEKREWIRENKYKEIENVQEFLENEKRLSDKDFIEHHNFLICDK